MRIKSYWIWRVLWLAWLGSECLESGHIRFSGSFTSLTSLSVEGANESEIELSPSFGRLLNGGGLCNKEAQDKSFAAVDDTFLTSRDNTCQQSILLQKKPAYQGKGREEMLWKVGQTNVFAWYIWKVGLEFVLEVISNVAQFRWFPLAWLIWLTLVSWDSDVDKSPMGVEKIIHTVVRVMYYFSSLVAISCASFQYPEVFCVWDFGNWKASF